jgi:hypothetical protein
VGQTIGILQPLPKLATEVAVQAGDARASPVRAQCQP